MGIVLHEIPYEFLSSFSALIMFLSQLNEEKYLSKLCNLNMFSSNMIIWVHTSVFQYVL